MLGSGVNLLGYNMFHGGRNPEGGPITLQESQRTGYPTDVPELSYDFQAPLGEFGQERESLRKLKLVHYFLEDFGNALAPMAPHAPDKQPASASDSSVPRVSARTKGEAGFVFLSNYVRGLSMPPRPGFQIALQLPGGVVHLPESPIDLPTGAYGIWPVNLPLGGTTLRYSTAQMFKRVVQNGRTIYCFFALPGVQPEFSFGPGTPVLHMTSGVHRADNRNSVLLRASPTAQSMIQLPGDVSILVLPEATAEQIWQVDDPSVLVRTAASFFSDRHLWTLQSKGNPQISFGVLGSTAEPKTRDGKLTSDGRDGIFDSYSVTLPSLSLVAQVQKVTQARPRGPWILGKKAAWQSQAVPLAPADKAYDAAAMWSIRLPKLPQTPTVSNLLLRIRYEGDAARLLSGSQLVDDNFWNGLPWTVGLRELGLPSSGSGGPTLQLKILPLPQHYPMYIERADRLQFTHGIAGDLIDVTLVPQYQVTVEQPKAAADLRGVAIPRVR